MVSVQDHKRIHDGDKGPNTGGMGTVSPSTHLSRRDAQADHAGHRPAHHRAAWPPRGASTRASSTSGLMITDKGPRVLEFNARFGDPETQVIMARMKSDIVPILKGVRRGRPGRREDRVGEGPRGVRGAGGEGLSRRPPRPGRRSAASTTLQKRAGHRRLPRRHRAEGRQAGHGGRPRARGDRARPTSTPPSPRAYEGVARVSFDGMHYRKDIGRKALARLHAPGRRPPMAQSPMVGGADGQRQRPAHDGGDGARARGLRRPHRDARAVRPPHAGGGDRGSPARPRAAASRS